MSYRGLRYEGGMFKKVLSHYLERGGVTVSGVGLRGRVWGGVRRIEGGDADPDGDEAIVGVVAVGGAEETSPAVMYEGRPGWACGLRLAGLKDGGYGCC